jgi:hypothetical protein
MKRFWILPLAALVIGCNNDDSGTLAPISPSEQTEEAALLVAEAVALESGGVLEEIEATLLEELGDGGLRTLVSAKDRETDEALFDSSSCTWTLNWVRSHEGPWSGFRWEQTRTLHYMDEEGGCIVRPEGDGAVRGIDSGRQFAGESWNRRSSGTRSGHGAWELRGLHDDEPGVQVNGVHHREGAGEVLLRRENGDTVRVEHSFTLDIEAHELVVIQRDGRRIPIAGWMHIVYHAERGDRVIDREVTLTFGEGGGRMAFDGGDEYGVNLVSGELE